MYVNVMCVTYTRIHPPCVMLSFLFLFVFSVFLRTIFRYLERLVFCSHEHLSTNTLMITSSPLFLDTGYQYPGVFLPLPFFSQSNYFEVIQFYFSVNAYKVIGWIILLFKYPPPSFNSFPDSLLWEHMVITHLLSSL